MGFNSGFKGLTKCTKRMPRTQRTRLSRGTFHSQRETLGFD